MTSLYRAWIWGKISFPVSHILAVEGDSPMGLLLLEVLSLQTTFLNVDLTKYHLRIYIYSGIFFNRFPRGMFSLFVLGCSFSHD